MAGDAFGGVMSRFVRCVIAAGALALLATAPAAADEHYSRIFHSNSDLADWKTLSGRWAVGTDRQPGLYSIDRKEELSVITLSGFKQYISYGDVQFGTFPEGSYIGAVLGDLNDETERDIFFAVGNGVDEGKDVFLAGYVALTPYGIDLWPVCVEANYQFEQPLGSIGGIRFFMKPGPRWNTQTMQFSGTTCKTPASDGVYGTISFFSSNYRGADGARIVSIDIFGNDRPPRGQLDDIRQRRRITKKFMKAMQFPRQQGQ